MNITPSQSTLQAFGTSPTPSAPSTQTRQPAAQEVVERPAPSATQRVDAAPRAEAPVRPDADARQSESAASESDRPGSRLNILV